MNDTTEITPLKGEGDCETIKRVRVRIECEACGEPATKRHTYLLDGCRRNPKSSAYGRDDCSFCSDEDHFTCDECPQPRVEGMDWCSTFTAGDRFGHMFLRWRETKIL